MTNLSRSHIAVIVVVSNACVLSADAQNFQPIPYNNPGLTVDLGVGLWAWPMPMDYDQDGDNDLVGVCPDTPYNGAYFFENTEGDVAMPVFKPAVRLSGAQKNPQVSFVDGKPRVLTPGYEYTDLKSGLDKRVKLAADTKVHDTGGRIRANQWKYADYDNDGATDIIVGIGDWTDYGWDDAYNDRGVWTNGPLRGFVYLLRNTASDAKPVYAEPVKIQAGGQPIDVYGMPSPNLADFDGDGDLDIICGEFLDGFTFFLNTGTRDKPVYAPGVRLTDHGQPIKMDLQMITPSAIDWDKDGDVDLICGDEDGRVAFIENTGRVVNAAPLFRQPRYFQQEAENVKFGALVTPVGFDWDNDGDDDLICGNTAGYIGFIENLDGAAQPKWAAPVKLMAGDEVIRIQAGPNGSIQGPCEAKWGYTTLSVADWNHDGLPDLVVNSIWGSIVWYENVGKPDAPKLAAAQPVRIENSAGDHNPEWNWWSPNPGELASQWRTTPVVTDWNEDGLLDLVMLDAEGYLAFFQRKKIFGGYVLTAPQRVFYATGHASYDNKQNKIGDAGDGLLRLNANPIGKS
ncbi:MAG: FG-GAP repeat domain-containing protein, partial [Planctomycetota bacterium]